MLLLLTLGFVPHDEAQPLVLEHLRRTPAVQHALNTRPDVAAFRARFDVSWLRWDERNATPRALLAEGIPVSELDELVHELAALAGVDPTELELRHADDDSWHYVQRHEGALVEHAWVDLYGGEGRITGGFFALHRPRLAGPAHAGEVVLPLEGDGLRYAWATAEMEGSERVYRARDGRELLRHGTRHYLDLTAYERTIGDELITVPARDVQVESDEGVASTDTSGAIGLTPPYDVRLQGSYLEVREYQQGTAVAYDVADEVLDADDDITQAAAVNQHHFHVVRDWLEARYPDHAWLPDRVQSTVNIYDGSCNAYYTGGTINFYVADDGRCHNFGEIADVVYHEVGHGIHHYILEGGSFAGDVSEGSADYVSATINDDPTLSPNARPDGTAIREIETDKRYPDDINGEVHNDGLIWASFLWNLRDQWIDTYGYDDGVERTDLLFLEALSTGPALTDLFEAVVLADDDNADLADGTPHLCELVELLAHHGLADEMGLVLPEHAPLDHQASSTDGYPVTFTLSEITADCGTFDPDSAELHYVVDPAADAVLAELSFETLQAERDGETYTATIPRQFPGSVVAYYMSWSSGEAEFDTGAPPSEPVTDTTHGGRTDQLYRFAVGDREALWCDDFESGWGEWTHGTGLPFTGGSGEGDQWEIGDPSSSGGTFDPDAPYAGDAVLGMAMGTEGDYAANSQQYALSPAISAPVEDGADRWLYALATRRWLTVEDGYYDQARIRLYDGALDPADWVDGGDTGWTPPSAELGEAIWSNYATETSDGASEHTLDTSWFGHDVDLRGLVEPGEDVRFAWTLTSDGGLEYGGWHLDDVCVVTLADVPGHYRVKDLVVTRDGDAASLAFSWPFMSPLYSGVVVRSTGAPPSDVDDGDVLLLEVSPEAGAEVVLDDSGLGDAEVYYAVFTADDEDWYLDTVEGENLALASLDEAPPVDTGSPGLTDSGGVEPADGEGAAAYRKEPNCACATGPVGAVWTLPWLAGLALLRRRRVASR